MARFQTGDMWAALPEADLFCITTNAQTRADGALVMGRGIAREAAQRFPGLAMAAGRRLALKGWVGKKYGLFLPDPHGKFALFQVKDHWRDDADPDLIRFSVKLLRVWCEVWTRQHGRPPRVHLNFPGIGNGRLAREAVLPLLEPLPDCVTVWELPLVADHT